MNFWKTLVILLTISAIGLLAAATVLDWQHYEELGWLRPYSAEEQGPPSFLRNRPSTLITTLGAFFTLYLSGVFVLYIFPDRTHHINQALVSSTGQLVRLTLLGLLTGVLIVTIAASSALTMGTFPLTVFLGSILFLSSFLGYVALSYCLGNRLLRMAGWDYLSPLYALLLGLLILFSLGQIPYLGMLIGGLSASLSLGAVIATRFGTGRPWNLAPLLKD